MVDSVRSPALKVVPLTVARFADLEAVFASRGCSVARGCWCMYYRWSGRAPAPPKGEYRKAQPEGTPVSVAQRNRAAFKALLVSGRFLGLLAYHGKDAVGWLSLGPREDYAKLQRSPVMKPVDGQPVWSVVCFVVAGPWRGRGVARALLDAAIALAKRRDITLEAYPVDKVERSADENLWFGPKSMFDDCGFEEVARRKPARPVVRLRPV